MRGWTWVAGRGRDLHTHNPNTLTRCGLMTSELPQHWTVFKQIFSEHWDGFKQSHHRYDTPYYHVLVNKMLECGDPDKMG